MEKQAMELNNFNYNLPKKLIAQYPLADRNASRMLVVQRKEKKIYHELFSDLPKWVCSKDMMVLNNSKVFKARLLGVRPSGGRVECFLLESPSDNNISPCLIKSSARKENLEFSIGENITARVVGRGKKEGIFQVAFEAKTNLKQELEQVGHVPLPPYIERKDEAQDTKRYQTTYAKIPGSVAAPTAGLHFNEEMLKSLKNKGTQLDYITLHVGYGTFQPIQTQTIEDHKMHEEYFSVPRSVQLKMNAVKKNGGRRIAVGTTTVRALESAARKQQDGITDIFLRPGSDFLAIDGLLTNFHQPKSSLIVLLAAILGEDLLWKAYDEAIQREYRFLSYGDCMLVL